MDNRYKNVFKPGTYPEITYVSREEKTMGYTYEERLQQCLSIDGYLTYIVGASKCGKTVLCEKVIGNECMIAMSGNDFAKVDDFWNGVGKKIGLSQSSSYSEETEAHNDNSKKSSLLTKNYLSNKDSVVQFFKENNKVLVLDDFHYAPADIQYEIACQLKEVIRLGFQAVIISLPHRSDDAIRLNPDLAGRLSVIEIDMWSDSDLCQIAEKGFFELGKTVDDRYISRIAMESIHSPQLMQSICLNIGLLPEFDDNTVINDNIIEKACHLSCVNLPYADVVRFYKTGPSSRGQKHLHYKLKDGSERDVYDLILKILADNPPLVELSFLELMDRINRNIEDAKLPNAKIQSALKNWMKILELQTSPLYHVLEWKDNAIHILDNLFLFYLRWRKDE